MDRKRGTKRAWVETITTEARPLGGAAEPAPHPLDKPSLGAVPAHAAAQSLLDEHARGALRMDFS